MKLNKIFKKFNLFFLKNIKSISIIFSILIILIIGFFLYFNFYQTIISAKQIIVLQSDIAPATINTKLLDEVELNFENKLKPTNYNWDKFSNIFSQNLSQQYLKNNSNFDNISPQINF